MEIQNLSKESKDYIERFAHNNGCSIEDASKKLMVKLAVDYIEGKNSDTLPTTTDIKCGC